MNNFFVVSKPSVSKTVGNIQYSRYNNTPPPAPQKPTPKTVIAVAKANAIKQQIASAASNVKTEVKPVSGISHLITKKHTVKQYRAVTGISHLLDDAK